MHTHAAVHETIPSLDDSPLQTGQLMLLSKKACPYYNSCKILHENKKPPLAQRVSAIPQLGSATSFETLLQALYFPVNQSQRKRLEVILMPVHNPEHSIKREGVAQRLKSSTHSLINQNNREAYLARTNARTTL